MRRDAKLSFGPDTVSDDILRELLIEFVTMNGGDMQKFDNVNPALSYK